MNGYLTHVSGVVARGTMWLQVIRHCMVAARTTGSVLCSEAAAAELRWWDKNVSTFDVHLHLMGSRRPQPRSSFCMSTDATGNGGWECSRTGAQCGARRARRLRTSPARSTWEQP